MTRHVETRVKRGGTPSEHARSFYGVNAIGPKGAEAKKQWVRSVTTGFDDLTRC